MVRFSERIDMTFERRLTKFEEELEEIQLNY